MRKQKSNSEVALKKCATGIQGLDEITFGGLPKGRPTLVCGGPGCGKTLLGVEFLVRGAKEFNEPGVFISFEETENDLATNVHSLGFELNNLINQKKIFVDNVFVERREIEETGEYDLEGLFIRIENAVNSVGAKRIVLDTIESLFSGFTNHQILRAEIRRLFRWLKDRGLTAIITGERGDKTLTREGLEEYVSDCVIFLDNRITEEVATRRLQIIKYRGSKHGMNEFPFIVTDKGIMVMPITSLDLKYEASKEFITSGLAGFDSMLNGKGFYRGSSVFVSGTAGTGKTTYLSHFVDSICRKGEKALYFAFEESESQIIRNMKSVNIDLEQWVKKGLLKLQCSRASSLGLEAHLTNIILTVNEFKPSFVVFDPINTFIRGSNQMEVKALIAKIMDFLKEKKITTVFTH